jgi:predicted permease
MFLGELWRKALMFFRPKQFRDEIDEELQLHLAMKEADLRAAGLEENESRYAARVRLGNPILWREKSEDAWGWTALDALLQDLRYALRILRKSPVFTTTAMLTLALGIGANTAIFSLINAVLLRAMPVRDPSSLVQIARFWAGQRATLSYPLYSFFRDQSHSFAGMLAQSSPSKQEIDIGGAPETAETQMVSGLYYNLLGVQAIVGHTFTADYDRAPGRSPFAVISYRYWQRRFGLNPSAIGKTFKLHQTVFTIVGVTPKEFFGTMPGHDPDVTFPISMDAEVNRELNRGKSWLADPQTNWLFVLGRLKAGVSLEQAKAETRVLFRNRIRADAGREKDTRERNAILAQELNLEPASAGLDSLRVKFSEPLLFLMCIVGLVLLLACMNLSSLLVGRTLARLREVSVRIAVGAGRGRLVRQFLAESLSLACAGGLLGIVLAQLFCRLLVIFISNGEDLFLPAQPDLRVLAFTGSISLLASVAVGLAPALYATRLNITPGLKEARSGRRKGLARLLIVAQIAISLLLLVGASLFVRTLINLRTLDAGFRRAGVLLFSIDSDKAGYKSERLRNLRSAVLERLNALPGVSSASLCFVLVLSGGEWSGTVDVENYTYQRGENNLADFNEVGPKFFRTMGTPILMGREFDERDQPSSQKVVIVNEAFARHYFGNESPLGKHVKLPESAVIIGVVKDVRSQDLKEAAPRIVYFPALQNTSPQPWSTYLVRVNAGGPLRLVQSVSQVIHRIDPVLQVTDPKTLADVVDRSILNQRILATLSGLFGVIALLLTYIGIFGVMASYVARRENEFGIRFALGARRRDVLRTVLFELAMMLAAGVVIGLLAAISVTWVARSLLFELKPNDPGAFAVAVLLLSAAALGAGYLPARRAARIDPMEALRAE